MFIPDPDLDFFTHPRFRIPDSGVKKAPEPGSGSTTLVVFMARDVMILMWATTITKAIGRGGP